MRVGWSTTAIFGDLSGYFFGNLRDKASNIIWRYATRCRPVVGCNGNISETGKDRGKVTMECLQEVMNPLSNGTIPNPLCPPFPQDWVSPPTSIAIISGTGKATDVKFGRYIYRVHRSKSPLKNLRKGTVGVSRDSPILGVPPIIPGMGKATKARTSNSAETLTGSM